MASSSVRWLGIWTESNSILARLADPGEGLAAAAGWVLGLVLRVPGLSFVLLLVDTSFMCVPTAQLASSIHLILVRRAWRCARACAWSLPRERAVLRSRHAPRGGDGRQVHGHRPAARPTPSPPPPSLRAAARLQCAHRLSRCSDSSPTWARDRRAASRKLWQTRAASPPPPSLPPSLSS